MKNQLSTPLSTVSIMTVASAEMKKLPLSITFGSISLIIVGHLVVDFCTAATKV